MFKVVSAVLLLLLALHCNVSSTSCGPPVVACYFINSAWYRPGVGKFMPSDIDISLCTHIYYAFAVLHPESLTLVPSDTWADYDNHFYDQITNLKKQGKIVILSMGGWRDSQGNKYSKLVGDNNARQNFITQSKQFVQQHGFQGLDIDWEFPVCWQTDCSAGPSADKQNFVSFIINMKFAYEAAGLLLTAAVSPSMYISDQAYNIPVLSQYLDLIGVMTYDYHSAFEGVTGANSPQMSHNGSPATFQTLDYYVQKGADPCKLLVGIPMYAKSFTLANTGSTSFGATVTGPGVTGWITSEPGFLAYYELCSQIKSSSWNVVHTYENSSYAYNNNQWASYCSPEDIMMRAKLILSKPYRGAMVWALDSDDFTNMCGCGKYPLLQTLNVGLGRISGSQALCP